MNNGKDMEEMRCKEISFIVDNTRNEMVAADGTVEAVELDDIALEAAARIVVEAVVVLAADIDGMIVVLEVFEFVELVLGI